MDMLGVVLIDVGLLCLLLGTVSLIKPLRILRVRTRNAGLLLAGCGLLVILAGMTLPAPEIRVTDVRTRLDDFLPAYQFTEIHTIPINAPAERVYAAIKAVEPDEILLFRTLTWMRRFGQRGSDSILNPPPHEPIMDTALRTGFFLLADDRDREIVFGLMGSRHPGEFRSKPTPEEFKALNRSGIVKIGMNFHILQTGAGHCILTTETRTYATDAASRRMFARYWRVIYPGSATIRRMWLRAIKRRAEAS